MNNGKIKISLKSVSLSFGKKQVLKNITADIFENKVTALIGPSGCGKSTLLRSFNRMHDLADDVNIEGTILLDNQNIYDKYISVTEVRKRVGMVFQKPNPFPKSIYDNVAYGLKINNMHNGQVSEVVESALKESFLWEEVKDDLKKPAMKLSGGQQQRLCIARTVAIRPEVILMDEPCSALDPHSTAKIEELIRELKKDYSIIIVTHNMQQAQRVSDRTLFMYLGELIEMGATKELFENPNQELTKNYINGHFG